MSENTFVYVFQIKLKGTGKPDPVPIHAYMDMHIHGSKRLFITLHIRIYQISITGNCKYIGQGDMSIFLCINMSIYVNIHWVSCSFNK